MLLFASPRTPFSSSSKLKFILEKQQPTPVFWSNNSSKMEQNLSDMWAIYLFTYLFIYLSFYFCLSTVCAIAELFYANHETNDLHLPVNNR